MYTLINLIMIDTCEHGPRFDIDYYREGMSTGGDNSTLPIGLELEWVLESRGPMFSELTSSYEDFTLTVI